MKSLFALLLVFFSASVFASVDQCESSNQQSVPSASARAAPRIKHKIAAAPVIGPKLHLTPYIPVRPFAAPARIKISTASRYDCLAPVSMPPGAIRIGYSVPYVGPRPEWGTPTPSYLATGPTPVYPGSPDDFRPAAYAPPGFVPPAPNELPEPPTIALILLGAFLLMRKSPKLSGKGCPNRIKKNPICYNIVIFPIKGHLVRKVSISKARKFIELFGVRLNEEINKQPISHSRDHISFRLTKEQREKLREGLSQWKTWDVLVVSEGYELWQVGSSRQVIGVTDDRYGQYKIFLDNTYQH